ncbi:tyrosine recombinase [Rickettsiales endosymbiont of Stachyamoeba lipophora]|uniref:tyrosine recombinase n=1 Tax=Rickettsiales endosymbiont of Stachyamoeba lipophora TaxID=2486578 RepID=UPI000F653251|nr:tyrosine recombinase [Rickettsiales endosymbiont of Stachyamoeba lipophora]AZL15621.1 tyrosine recombinase [Rickettsiales endosymbiont of Stachyamoeba lipophora]
MEVIKSFLEYLQSEVTSSLNTIESYKNDLLRLESFIASNNLNITNITADVLNNFISKLIIDRFAISTVNRNISVIKHFFNYLVEEGIIRESPAINLELLQLPRNLPKFLSLFEVKALLETAQAWQSPKFYIMLELLYATGMRVSELVSLKYSSLKFEQGKILPFLIVKGKGNKERLIPLHLKICNLLAEYLKDLDSNGLFLFPSTSKEGYVTRQRFGQFLKEIAIRSNIDPVKVSPHILRHSFATHILENGANLKLIQELLGHADISTTQIYTHLTMNKLASIVKDFHPLSQGKKPGQL